MENGIKVIGRMIKSKVMGIIIGPIMTVMMVIGSVTRDKVREFSILIMVIFMTEIGRMTKKMVKVNLFGLLVTDLKVNGKKT